MKLMKRNTSQISIPKSRHIPILIKDCSIIVYLIFQERRTSMSELVRVIQCTSLFNYYQYPSQRWFNSFLSHQQISIWQTLIELQGESPVQMTPSPLWGSTSWANTTLLQRTFQLRALQRTFQLRATQTLKFSFWLVS